MYKSISRFSSSLLSDLVFVEAVIFLIGAKAIQTTLHRSDFMVQDVQSCIVVVNLCLQSLQMKKMVEIPNQ